MVATRNHPSDFETTATESPAKPSPTKRSTRSSDTNHISPTKAAAPSSESTSRSRIARRAEPTTWQHTPSNLTLIWLAISLPLVIWDTGYVLLRPYSMPGGFLHAPLWTPYDLYGKVDHVYGFKAWEAHNGWTAAQGTINAIETAAYLVYLYIVYTYGQQEAIQGTGAPDKSAMGPLRTLSESRTLHGRVATYAVLIAYSTALITFVKTILYWLNEAFSGFDSIGHNDWLSLLFLWIIPNGAWILFPAYMIYVFGKEVLQGLEAATVGDAKLR